MQMLERGIWTAPWLGPSGEPVLIAITSEGKLLLPPEAVPRARLEYRTGFLWGWLDTADPIRRQKKGRPAPSREDTRRFPTLEAWLAAVHRGEFPELDQPGQGRDRNGSDLLRADPAALRRFYATRDRMHRTWPRLCTSCGVEFKPDRRAIRRCPACRKGGAHA